jgi:hypothetical protein
MCIISDINYTIDLISALDKGINKGIGDLAKNRADHFFKQFAGKFVGQLKLDLASVFRQ